VYTRETSVTPKPPHIAAIHFDRFFLGHDVNVQIVLAGTAAAEITGALRLSNGVGRGRFVAVDYCCGERATQDAAQSFRASAAGQVHAMWEPRLPGRENRTSERGDLPQAVLQVLQVWSASYSEDVFHQSAKLRRQRDLL